MTREVTRFPLTTDGPDLQISGGGHPSGPGASLSQTCLSTTTLQSRTKLLPNTAAVPPLRPGVRGSLSCPQELLVWPRVRAPRAQLQLGLLPLQLSQTFFHPKFLGRARFLAGPRRRRESGRDARDPRHPRSPTPGSASCRAGPAPRSVARALRPGLGGSSGGVSEGGVGPPPAPPPRGPGSAGLGPRPPRSGPASGVRLQLAGAGWGLRGRPPSWGRGALGRRERGRRGAGAAGGGGAPRRAGAPPESGFPGGTTLVPGWGPEPARPPRLHGPGTHFRASVYTTRPGPAGLGLRPLGPRGNRSSLPPTPTSSPGKVKNRMKCPNTAGRRAWAGGASVRDTVHPRIHSVGADRVFKRQ